MAGRCAAAESATTSLGLPDCDPVSGKFGPVEAVVVIASVILPAAVPMRAAGSGAQGQAHPTAARMRGMKIS